ncbi:DMT family transporter [Rhodoferax aquaticus]|uniref:DMT family transporter n=1 Tax=Rhodoferax aquaticus TaxID=2527691 RepID=A0A515EPL9_9BURK|nr:DMT family transporter [Rhodoferax aquaticus]QDL54607.1 DMT family transporter [Rhodoferax aquaticus]
MSHPTARQRLSAYTLLATSMGLVGVYIALSKPLVLSLPVFLLAWLRFGIGGLATWPWLKRPKDEAPMSRNTKQLLFMESFLGNFLFSICMLFGVSMTSAVAAGVILAATPAAIALLSWGLLREKIGTRIWLALVCGGAGIALMSLAKSEQTLLGTAAPQEAVNYSNAWLGNLLVFAAVLCEAAYAVIGKKLTGVLAPMRITALINLWGFVLMTPMGLYFAVHFDFSAVSLPLWALLVFYALSASVGTVWLWMTGLKTVPAGQAGIFAVMLPICSALVGVTVLGETLGTMQLMALALSLGGILLATVPSSPVKAFKRSKVGP